MTFVGAARRVLSDAGTPLTADEITRRVLKRGIQTNGTAGEP
jgi:hypothetical protein